MGKRVGKRYINEIYLKLDSALVENTIQGYLKNNSFKYVNEKGENFYKTSSVLRGFKYWYDSGVLHIEAWLGKIGKEMDISDGKLVGGAYKIPYYNSVLSLLGALEKERQLQESTDSQSYEQVSRQPYLNNNHINSDVVQEINKANDRNAVFAFWLSIAALILVANTKISMFANVGSYYLAFVYGLKSGKRGMAKAAIFINTVATVIAIVIFLSSLFS